MQEEQQDVLQTQTANPMKLFISYSYPEADICRRICDALRRRGHQVWFDETPYRTVSTGRNILRELEGRGIIRQGGYIHFEEIDRELTVDVMECSPGARPRSAVYVFPLAKRVKGPVFGCFVQILDTVLDLGTFGF